MKPNRIRELIPALFFVALMLFGGAVPVVGKFFERANYVLIGGGEFTMGSPASEVSRQDDETRHQVRLSNFLMSKYAVTVAEFRRFEEASGYRTDADKAGFSVIISNCEVNAGKGVNWRCGVSGSARPQSEENHPVVHVSWNDAVAYCKWLSVKTGKKFRLPTEAEREYACRAGSTTAFNTGESLTTDQANYGGNCSGNNNLQGVYPKNTVAVNCFLPNSWGLYNMHGNVWEWCSDFYGENYYNGCKAKGRVLNPAGPATGSYRVLRGGSWGNEADCCRSAYRNCGIAIRRSYFIGFRLVLVPSSVAR